MRQSPIALPERESYSKHRREFVWQIVVPIILAGLIGIAAMVLVWYATFESNGDVSRWAAVATIWLVAPFLVVTLVFAAGAWGLAYGLGRLLKIAPRYTGLAQIWMLWLNAEIVIWVDKLMHPLVLVKAWWASRSKARLS